MPFVQTDDEVKLFYVEEGSGTPIVFVHEFAGDHRSYEAQMRHFARKYRVIAYNARGYPPSEVPTDPAKYSQYRARDDVLAIMNGLDIQKAHIVGISMGGFATVHFGLTYPERALSLTVGGCGYGAKKDDSRSKFKAECRAVADRFENEDQQSYPERTLLPTVRGCGYGAKKDDSRSQFKLECRAVADRFENEDMKVVSETYANGPTRQRLKSTDPRGWEEFRQQLSEHSGTGSALTLRGVQSERPSLYDLKDQLEKLELPTLIVTGDEDEPCLDASVYMKRTIPKAALLMMPQTGHNVNMEDPTLFNTVVGDFISKVDNGRWTVLKRTDNSIIGGGGGVSKN